MEHIISIIIENEAGALSKVVGLFSARGYNIESLTVSNTKSKNLSRITILTIGSNKIVEQIIKQLSKLIEIVTVSNLSKSKHIKRELLLIKVSIENEQEKDKLTRLNEKFSARVLNKAQDYAIIELSSESCNINEFIATFPQQRIIEIARTGITSIES